MATEYRICECGYVYSTAELQVTKPWWRKVIWRSVLIYVLALLIATTLALVQHDDWFEVFVWYALFLPVACVISRSYL